MFQQEPDVSSSTSHAGDIGRIGFHKWTSQGLLAALQQQIADEGKWQAHVYSGYTPVVYDLTAFFRPTLRNCGTKHYSSAFKRMVSAIPFGMIVRIGSIADKRIPLPVAFVRAAVDQRE